MQSQQRNYALFHYNNTVCYGSCSGSSSSASSPFHKENHLYLLNNKYPALKRYPSARPINQLHIPLPAPPPPPPLCPSNSLRYHICNPLSGALSVPPFTLGREVGIIGSLLLVALISDHFVVGRRIHHGGILRHWHSPSASRLRHAHWIRGVRRVRRIRLRWSVRVVLTRHRHSMLLMLWHGI